MRQAKPKIRKSHYSTDPPVHRSSGGSVISLRRCPFFPLPLPFSCVPPVPPLGLPRFCVPLPFPFLSPFHLPFCESVFFHTACIEASLPVLGSEGTYQENKDVFFQTKTASGGISRTGISHAEREFIVDSESSMHMMSKSDFIHEVKETTRKSIDSCTITTANGSIAKLVESRVYVRDLDMLTTVQ